MIWYDITSHCNPRPKYLRRSNPCAYVRQSLHMSIWTWMPRVMLMFPVLTVLCQIQHLCRRRWLWPSLWSGVCIYMYSVLYFTSMAEPMEWCVYMYTLYEPMEWCGSMYSYVVYITSVAEPMEWYICIYIYLVYMYMYMLYILLLWRNLGSGVYIL